MIVLHILGILLTILVSVSIYYACNQGMARNARGQQTRRFIIASVLAWLPVMVSGASFSFGIVTAWLTGVAWMLSYPLLYHLTNRKSSPDYENYGEIACGIYFFGWLSAIWLLGGGVVAAVLEWLLLLVSLALVVYYLLYGTCIDANGMKIVQDSHPNEVIEFAKSYPWWKTMGTVLAVVLLLVGAIWANLSDSLGLGGHSVPLTIFLGAYVLGFGWYIFKTHRGMFVRSGIVTLWLVIKEYSANNKRYVSEMERRIADLQVKQLGGTMEYPHTVMLVIGESASRDYMSAFTEMEHDTTPWMRQMAEDKQHTVIYPNAYSCAMHTVQVLEKALTEYNQYTGLQFYESCSIVDIAHKLGYRVHWYSNQGHLGANDTPITLVANTSEVAKWTKQDLGRVQYDQSLVDFLDELDPAQNNFLVLHLKGSHFNFLSRYPQEATVWGEPGVQDNTLNYENSLHYTDTILEQFYQYGVSKLNLQAMVYFSDHATVPDRHRSPNFSGFGATRIPLMVWMSDTWQALHIERWQALKQNAQKHWTNDLAYELLCGVLDCQSNHFDASASLAYEEYGYKHDELLTYEGKARIADDES